MSEIKLLPCPFCGGEVEIVGINNENPFYVVCENCGLEFGHPDYGKEYHYYQIIKAWNTRKPMERIVERLQGKKKTLCGTYDFYTKPLDRPSCKIAFNNGICESIEIIKEEGGIE